MKRRCIFLMLMLCVLCCGIVKADRIKESFNFDWQFSYDQQEWHTVNLPHDYLIGQSWVTPDADEKADKKNEAANVVSKLSARAFKELRKGFYRKTFITSNNWQGQRVIIDFEGIMLVGDVFLNGNHIGKTDYGYLGFECDITDKLLWTEENVLEVSCDVGAPNNSRWYSGGGLYRDVNIVVTNSERFFTRHPLQILSSITEGRAQIDIQVECTNKTKTHPKTLTFISQILDAEGNCVAESTSERKYYPRQRTNEYKLDSIVLDNPRLWDCESPNLYTAVVTVLDDTGNVADKVSEIFGIRTIEYGADFGFKLNGKKVLLKGIANHHTLGALGAAAYERAIEKRLLLLKEFGVNHIRTSHNPYSESFLRLCDKHGILVVDELYDKWNKQYMGGRSEWSERWQQDIPEWIKRDRNHPCVVMWSLGNELQQNWDMDFADWGITPYRLQKTLLNRYDETRPVTVAMHPRYRDVDTDSVPAPLALETDIASYNYRYMYFPGDSRRFPEMIFYQSEANTANIGKNWFEMDLDRVVGLAYWGAIDYLGESMGWPRKGWTLGEFDISLQPKPIAYFLKSYFTDQPMVHLSVLQGSSSQEWNGVLSGSTELTDSWNEEITTIASSLPLNKLTLQAFSNAEEVELLINGKSRGRIKNNLENPAERNRFVFKDIVYEKGKAEAVAYNNGVVVARHRLETTGKPVALKIVADLPTNKNSNSAANDWKANGIDLNHIRIYAVDKKGRRVPGISGKLSFRLEGDAEIVAMSNGDNSCDEINVPTTPETGEYSLYDGAALIILRSKRNVGNIRLTVSLNYNCNLISKTITLKTSR